MSQSPLHLFDAFGIEMEYMIVDRETLDIRPICDKLMESVAGAPVTDIEDGPIAWSNELALHIVEIKTNGPATNLDHLPELFQGQIHRINTALESFNACLMPTAMHPWMNPLKETKLWEHENGPIYRLYDQLFNCSGHGWSNLQSTHINFPFSGDEEFARLHHAIRLVLPLLPMLAASSPFQEGGKTGFMDTRLEFYRNNQRRFPPITGRVIPESVTSEEQYRDVVFGPILRDITPHDPDGILDPHFLNSRGAIARFDRRAIEIRLLDLQENPAADLAVAGLVIAVVKAMTEEKWSSFANQGSADTDRLAKILLRGIKAGGDAMIEEPWFLRLYDIKEESITGNAFWKQIASQLQPTNATIHQLLQRATLAQRLVTEFESGVDLRRLYGNLINQLSAGKVVV